MMVTGGKRVEEEKGGKLGFTVEISSLTEYGDVTSLSLLPPFIQPFALPPFCHLLSLSFPSLITVIYVSFSFRSKRNGFAGSLPFPALTRASQTRKRTYISLAFLVTSDRFEK